MSSYAYYLFSTAAEGFYQLFIISVLLAGIPWRPLIYFYMTDKFQDFYETMFRELSSKYEKNIYMHPKYVFDPLNIKGLG